MADRHELKPGERQTRIELAKVRLNALYGLPSGASGIVVFAHGAGSSRFSPRNRHVAEILRDAGLGTLLMDLLTEAEEQKDMLTRELRFDIDLLTERLVGATDWLKEQDETRELNIGYFGASTGAAAALKAAVERSQTVQAVVSRGGRPDLADEALDKVKAPTLLIVGGNDPTVLKMNEGAAEKMQVEHELVTVPGATHLFEEPGKLDEVAEHAKKWFVKYLS